MSALSSPPTRGASESRGASARGGRGRGVPIVYGGMTAVLLLAVVGLALSSPPPRTPPLAAVAPQVDDQVDVERLEQSSRFGEGAGGEGECTAGEEGCGGGARVEQAREQAVPQATSAPADFWPCVIGPGGPRQTEDPQSSPCKSERFRGDNGGATARGVTATEIRVAYFDGFGNYGKLMGQLLPPLVDHVNRRYELYGRKLRLVPVSASSGDRSDPAVQRLHAQEVAANEVFASIGYTTFGPHQAELAGLGVLSFVDEGWTGLIGGSSLAALAPYAWSVYPSLEESQEMVGALVCQTLAGRPARHGGVDVGDGTRRFGVLVEMPADDGTRLDAATLSVRLDACGADHRRYAYEHGTTDVTVLMRRMQADGVTTVICVCKGFSDRYTDAADDLLYTPEWLSAGLDDGVRWKAGEPDRHPRGQVAHMFGVTGQLRRPVVEAVGQERLDQQYWYHAARESDPDLVVSTNVADEGYGVYAQLLALASGVQWAGPDLTPETFEDALSSLRYPNPGVGAAPWFQPSAGFGRADHGLNSDFALFWWNDATSSMCYVGDGQRFRAGQLPTDADDLFFDPEAGCR